MTYCEYQRRAEITKLYFRCSKRQTMLKLSRREDTKDTNFHKEGGLEKRRLYIWIQIIGKQGKVSRLYQKLTLLLTKHLV